MNRISFAIASPRLHQPWIKARLCRILLAGLIPLLGGCSTLMPNTTALLKQWGQGDSDDIGFVSPQQAGNPIMAMARELKGPVKRITIYTGCPTVCGPEHKRQEIELDTKKRVLVDRQISMGSIGSTSEYLYDPDASYPKAVISKYRSSTPTKSILKRDKHENLLAYGDVKRVITKDRGMHRVHLPQAGISRFYKNGLLIGEFNEKAEGLSFNSSNTVQTIKAVSEETYFYEFHPNGVISKKTAIKKYAGSPSKVIERYSDEDLLISTWTSSFHDVNRGSEVRYDNYKFDEYGNWVSRDFHCQSKGVMKKCSTGQRVLAYY
ncbi:MAG TPA: hypothetical protein VIP51_05650 [Eoetvoesiella sp.]